MTFEEQYEAARYTTSYWASWGTTLVAPVLGAVCVALLLRRTWPRRRLYVLWAVACFLMTVVLTVAAIDEKWGRRMRIDATTDDEVRAISADGANRLFSPIIGAFFGGVAVVLVGVTAAVMHRIVPSLPASRTPELPADPV